MAAGKPSTNRQLFARATRVLVGGVNSPARSFHRVGGVPRFVERGRGAVIHDAEGRAYIDYVGGWGALLGGHAFRPVVEAVRSAARSGLCFGLATRLETALAEAVSKRCAHVEQMRFTTSGTEAVLTALRLVRADTGRHLVLVFDGGYHGHGDLGPTITAPYNDLAAVVSLVRRHRRDLAAILVEPVATNMGVVPPVDDFLQGLRTCATEVGARLVFDEVVTGFRLAPGGAADAFGVTPDLSVFGKALGGGLPVGAVGGPRAAMRWLAPEGPVFHAGTFAGHPLTMAAGLAQLEALASPRVLRALNQRSATFEERLRHALAGSRFPIRLNRVGSMWSMFFSSVPVMDAVSARRAHARRYAAVFHAALDTGIHLVPSPLEANFISTAHTQRQLDETATTIGRLVSSR
jgi:glutamate-1-semialdehyde 2,1-aminomutase